MNIGYIINYKWDPPIRGSGIHAYQVARGLKARGHTLSTIFYDYRVPLVKHYRRREFFKFLREIDAIYIRVDGTTKTHLYTLLKIARLFSLPIVWEINGVLDDGIPMGWLTKEEVKKLNRWRSWLAPFVDASINTCKELNDYAKNDLKIKNNYMIPLGSDTENFSPSKKNDEIYPDHKDCFKVVWAGSAKLAWHAFDIVHEVAKKVYALDKKIVFILIGKDPEQDKLGVEYKNIQVIEQVPYADIPQYLASADAALCLYQVQVLSKWNSTGNRSPMKLFDYMASGLPAICTQTGQIENIITHGHNGLLVKNNDVDQIVRQVLYLKNNRDKRIQMGREARKDVERYYNWDRIVQETERILVDLVARADRKPKNENITFEPSVPSRNRGKSDS